MSKLPSAPFDAKKSIWTGLCIIQLKLVDALTAITGTQAAPAVFTKNAHGLKVGASLNYVSGTGGTGITAGTTYYVVEADANTFKLSTTPGGAALALTAALTVGVFQPVVIFEAEKIDDDPSQTVKEYKRPGRDGVMRVRRSFRQEASEKWSFDMDEVKRLLEIFDGAMSGRKVGKCTFWFPDIDDPATACAMKSEEDFEVTIMRNGKTTFGGDVSKVPLQISSNLPREVQWSTDVDIT